MELGLGPGDIVLDEDPNFWPVYCDQTAAWINMPLATEVGLGLGRIVLDGYLAPLKRGTTPYFSVHIYCGQTAEWIKMPLGTEVDLSPGHIVLDEAQLPPPQRGTAAPSFWPMSTVAKRSPISATDDLL